MTNTPEMGRNGVAPDASNDGFALRCAGVVKRFGAVTAVDGLDLAVPPGTILALLGPSGCGKTTALRLIAGFERPDAGEIIVGGRVVSSAAGWLPPEKRRIGMVFQEGALFPHLTVEQNVGYGLRKDAGRANRIAEALELVGLSAMRRRLPHELSGGQQQRVALGRALAPRPDILLLDEPFSNLDAALREQLKDDVAEILRASGATAVFVTHDQAAALSVGDEVAVMRDGRLEQTGPPAAIFHAPQSGFVAKFTGAADFLPVRQENGRLTTELGPLDPGGNDGRFHCSLPGNAPDGRPDTLPAAAGWADGADGRLELMVRPDCVECYPDAAGPGVIAGREFRGAFYLYRVRLPSGQEVRSLISHIAEYPIGAAVSLRLRDGHQARLFVNGMLAGTAPKFR